MNNIPTPETDAAIWLYYDNGQPFEVIDTDFARKLERERDEARTDLEFRRGLYKVQEQYLETARRERDEAREKLSAAWQSLRYSQDEVLRLTFENRELRNLKNE
jgi:hypothetical protein